MKWNKNNEKVLTIWMSPMAKEGPILTIEKQLVFNLVFSLLCGKNVWYCYFISQGTSCNDIYHQNSLRSPSYVEKIRWNVTLLRHKNQLAFAHLMLKIPCAPSFQSLSSVLQSGFDILKRLEAYLLVCISIKEEKQPKMLK